MKKIICFIAVLLAAFWLAGQSQAGDDKGTEVTLDGLKSKTPAGWKLQPKNPNPFFKSRIYQFKVPHAEGDLKDADLIIFYFGKGVGGTVADNLKRWKAQFRPPEGKKIDEVSKVEKNKVGEVELTYFDVQGTFLDKFPPFSPNAKITPRENYRLLAVYFDSPNGPYFLRLIGPAKTVAGNKKDFDNWLKAFK